MRCVADMGRVVDGATSQRVADAWHLPDEFHEPAAANLAEDGHIARVRRTLDGMNWEVDGESPIVYVSVEIGVIKRPLATGARAQNLTPAQHLRLLLRAALLAGPGLRCRRRARSLSQAAVLGPRDDRTVPFGLPHVSRLLPQWELRMAAPAFGVGS